MVFTPDPRGYDTSSRLTDLSMSSVDNAGTTPKCIFTRDNFDWEMDLPPKHSAADTVIYEIHVRGFTIDPAIAEEMLPFQGRGEMQERRILESVRAILDTVSNDGDFIEISLPHSSLCHRLQVENLL